MNFLVADTQTLRQAKLCKYNVSCTLGIFLDYSDRSERMKREKRMTRERERKVVGGEGQSSATLSLINRATVIDYLE